MSQRRQPPAARRLPGAPVSLSASQGAAAAAHDILRSEWSTILANEPLGRGEGDPEILHDFRVAIRRTRTCLGHFKRALGADVIAPFGAEFKWLGRISGPARDLDVLVEALDERRGELDPRTVSDLEELRVFLHHRRARVRDLLEDQLASTRFALLRARWSEYLSKPDRYPTGPDGSMPVRDFVGDRLWSRFRRIANSRGVANAGTPVARLHALRIECKKLRYLLEFSRSLYVPSDMTALISSLKRLQNVLGAINDDETQEHALNDAARALLAESPHSVSTVLAIGAMQEQLRRDLDRQRHHFAGRFSRFVNEGEVRFRRVLGR